MSFNALGLVKLAASGVVGIGTGKIIGQIIKNNVAAPETMLDKVTVTAAAWVIGGVVTTATKKYTNETIDEVAGAVTGMFEKFRLDARLGRVNRGESTLVEEGLDPTQFEQDSETGHWQKKTPVEEPAAS